MANVSKDPHPICFLCHGRQCLHNLTFETCVGWNDDEWCEYVNIRIAFGKKNKRKFAISVLSFMGSRHVVAATMASASILTRSVPAVLLNPSGLPSCPALDPVSISVPLSPGERAG